MLSYSNINVFNFEVFLVSSYQKIRDVSQESDEKVYDCLSKVTLFMLGP